MTTSQRGTPCSAAVVALFLGFGAYPALGRDVLSEDEKGLSLQAEVDLPRDARIEYSTEPLVRDAGLALGGVQIVQGGLALAARPMLSRTFERRDWWAIAARVGWSLYVDINALRWSTVANHELGHALRRPADVEDYTLTLDGPTLPFLSPSGGSVVWSGNRRYSAWERMRSTAGGWEADSLFLNRARLAIYSGEGMHYGDGLAYAITKLRMTAYLLNGTDESRLASQDPIERRSDPLIYAEQLAEIDKGENFTPEAVSRRARELRRGAHWNLLDYVLWATTAAWLKGWVVDGSRTSSTPWITVGSLGLAPSVSFTLAPYGPETTALTGWRLGRRTGTLHARWTGAVDGGRVAGGGASLHLADDRLPVECLALDVWRDRSGSWGARFELSGVWRRSEKDRFGLVWRAGIKSRGPLVGFTDASRGYAGLGLSLRFD